MVMFDKLFYVELTAAVLLYVIVRLLLLLRKRNWKSTPYHEISLVLLLAAVVWIAKLTVFFPWRLDDPYKYNLQLFAILQHSVQYWKNNDQSLRYFIYNGLGNIAVFIPIGFFIPLTFRRKLSLCILYGFLLSLCIELIQFPIGRWSDVDDLLLNTLGAIIGVLIYKALNSVSPKFTNKFKVKLGKATK